MAVSVGSSRRKTRKRPSSVAVASVAIEECWLWRSSVARILANVLTVGCFLVPILHTTVAAAAYHPSNGGSGGGRRTPFLRRQDMVGIWRLTNRRLFFPSSTEENTTSREKKRDNSDDQNENQSIQENEIVVRLHENGSFTSGMDDSRDSASDDDTGKKPSSDELGQVLGRGGSWEYEEDQSKLILAPDRPEDTNPREVHDTLLTGNLVAKPMEQMFSSIPPTKDNEPNDSQKELLVEGLPPPSQQQKVAQDNINDEIPPLSSSSSTSTPSLYDFHLSVPKGSVRVGKFMYKKTHKAFFDEPMLHPNTVVGSFSLVQVLGNLNVRLQEEHSISDQQGKELRRIKNGKYHKKDFHGRRFYLTSTPLPINPHYAEVDKRYDSEQAMIDFRVLPITFHSNNTFSAMGSGKILRGRFGLTGEKRDRLWMQVNLFGAGRSAPGSVYSEGPGLSQEDRRGYRGLIQEYRSKNNNSTEDDAASTSDRNDDINDGDENSDKDKMLLFVDGDVFYGNDLGIQKRPSRLATFTMQEIVEEAPIDDLETNPSEEDDDVDVVVEKGEEENGDNGYFTDHDQFDGDSFQ